jgi:hypothetical protein
LSYRSKRAKPGAVTQSAPGRPTRWSEEAGEANAPAVIAVVFRPSAGWWPPLPGKYCTVSPTRRPATARSGSGHQVGAPWNPSPLGRVGAENRLEMGDRLKEAIGPADRTTPSTAASTRSTGYPLARKGAKGSAATNAAGSPPGPPGDPLGRMFAAGGVISPHFYPPARRGRSSGIHATRSTRGAPLSARSGHHGGLGCKCVLTAEP